MRRQSELHDALESGDQEQVAAYQIAVGFRDWLERVVAGPAENTEE